MKISSFLFVAKWLKLLKMKELKSQIEDYIQTHSKPIPVGSFVKKFINLIEIKQIDFANYLEIRPSNLNKILNGERRVFIEFALILEKLSNIDAELWLRTQSKKSEEI